MKRDQSMPCAGDLIEGGGFVAESHSGLRPVVDGCAVLRVDGTIEGLSLPRTLPSDDCVPPAATGKEDGSARHVEVDRQKLLDQITAGQSMSEASEVFHSHTQ